MKKSTFGIALLVSMVLTKTYLGSEVEDVNVVKNSTSAQSNLVSRTISFTPSSVNSVSTLIAQDLSKPEFKNETINYSGPSQNEIAEIALVENSEIEDLDVLPLETVSNTGYGLWEFTSTENSNEEGVPLDRGNTIMDGISRMFPLMP